MDEKLLSRAFQHIFFKFFELRLNYGEFLKFSRIFSVFSSNGADER